MLLSISIRKVTGDATGILHIRKNHTLYADTWDENLRISIFIYDYGVAYFPLAFQVKGSVAACETTLMLV